jgi:hypothetical protein
MAQPYTIDINKRVIPSIETDKTAAQQQDMSPVQKGQRDAESSKDRKNASVLADAGRQAALRAINYGLNQYGNLTGDYLTGQGIQQAQSYYQILSGAATVAGALGAAMTVGMIVATEVIKYNRNMENLTMLRQRAGVFTSGGRDTGE